MNTYLNLADWLVIFAHLGGIIALRMCFGKDRRRTRDYLHGNCNTPCWPSAWGSARKFRQGFAN